MGIDCRRRRGNISLLLPVKGKAVGDTVTVAADGSDSELWCTFSRSGFVAEPERPEAHTITRHSRLYSLLFQNREHNVLLCSRRRFCRLHLDFFVSFFGMWKITKSPVQG